LRSVEKKTAMTSPANERRVVPWIVWAAAVFVLVFCAVYARFVLAGIPHVHDEIVYVFQAKIFNLGRLTVESPCAPEAFVFPHVISNGRWYGQYPPGYPLLLMPWVALGIPWLLNPLLASLSIVLFFFLGKELYGRRVGILAAILGAASIWLLVMSSTLMAHTSGMFFMTVFMFGFARWMKSASITDALLLVFGMGMTLLIHPLTAALIATPFLAVVLSKTLSEPRRRWPSIAAMILVGFAFVSILGLYNLATNGNVFTTGYIVRYGPEHGYGLGRSGYTDMPLSAFLARMNLSINLRALNLWLFGWPLTSGWLLLPLVIRWARTRQTLGMDLLLLSSFGLLLLGYCGYWAFYPFIGPRFLFEGIQIPILLSALGLSLLLGNRRHFFSRTRSRKLISIAVAVSFAAHAAWIAFPRVTDPPKYDRLRTFDSSFSGVTGNLQRAIRNVGIHKAMILVKMVYSPHRNHDGGWWGSGFIHNDPLLRNDIIYVDGKPDALQKLHQCYPERSLYAFVGTLEQGLLLPLSLDGGRIKAGPPMSDRSGSRSHLRLLSDPTGLFTPYSEEFRRFIAGWASQHSPFEIEVPALLETGLKLKQSGRLEEAAFHLEAALQLEVLKQAKAVILDELAGCYMAMGNSQDAKRISDRVIDADRMSLDDIMPEKGF